MNICFEVSQPMPDLILSFQQNRNQKTLNWSCDIKQNAAVIFRIFNVESDEL